MIPNDKNKLPTSILTVGRLRLAVSIGILVIITLMFIIASFIHVQSGTRIAREAITRELGKSAHFVRVKLEGVLSSAELAIDFYSNRLIMDAHGYPGTIALPQVNDVLGIDIMNSTGDSLRTSSIVLPDYLSPYRESMLSFFRPRKHRFRFREPILSAPRRSKACLGHRSICD